MRRRAVPPDEWQFGSRTSEEVRGTLLRLLLDFVREVRLLPAPPRVALLGSLLTSKPRPHDVDVVLTVSAMSDLTALAPLARRLKGRTQGINAGADIFLATPDGHYVGRVCSYRECHPRALCHARHCGARPHLNDDLDVICLSAETVQGALELSPIVADGAHAPPDVVAQLLDPLRSDVAGGGQPLDNSAPAL